MLQEEKLNPSFGEGFEGLRGLKRGLLGVKNQGSRGKATIIDE
jgi:hypothetical protein